MSAQVSGGNQKERNPTPNWCHDFDHHETGFVEDPWPILDEIREECPVLHSDKYGGFWLLSRHADVESAARTPSDFTSTVPGVTTIPPVQGPKVAPMLPIDLDPPEHTKYRALISPVFRQRRIEALRPTIEAKADELIDSIVLGDGADLIADFAVPLSLHTLGTLMSLPPGDQQLWHDWVERMFEGSIRDPEDAAAAQKEYSAYLDDIIEQRGSADTETFFELLFGAEVDGRRLTHDEVQSFARLLLIAGHETTAKSMGMSLWFLAKYPVKRQELFDRPDLIPTAVDELLRLLPPVVLFGRNATRDIHFGDQLVEQGDVVALGFGPANRDPVVFAQPNEAMWDRKPNPHLTFGKGPHICIGAALARLELSVMLERFSQRLQSFTLDPDRPVKWKARGDQRGLVSLHVRL